MYLNCHTYYSWRYGTFSEKDLLELAQQNNLQCIALTDINNTSACLSFIRLSRKYRIRPIVGIDFRNGSQQQYVGIAKNNEGFLELNSFLSAYLHSKEPIPDTAPVFTHVFVIYPFTQVLHLNKQHFLPHEYIGVNVNDLRKLRFSGLEKHRDKLVALQGITFRNKREFNIHRLLRAIDNNTLLSKLPVEEQGVHERMYTRSEIENYFASYPSIVYNTEKLMEQCSIYFDFDKNRKNQNLTSYKDTREEDWESLKSLCDSKLLYRYPNPTEEIRQRLEKELNLIRRMDFVSFFLINWDIVHYAKKQGYYYVGRGSGSNSIVAYLLEITNVDPVELDLYFERFMNLYRTTPPDFDIDFSWRDREDVTRYIFECFGKNGQTALLGTYNTFQYSGAIRELGKVFGLPKHEIDVLSDGKYDFNHLDKLSQAVVRYGNWIRGIPNHLSIHAGGILIAEKSINYFSATELPPKGFPTTQFDMVAAEDVGLYKLDILGQRGLGKIKDTLSIIRRNRPQVPEIDINDIKTFIRDEKINQMVSEAKCMGCFYVESPAMRMLLKKLEVDNYLGLVAASSIIRPGVAKSGMMREYILRHKHAERREEAHPVMRELMEDTYGVMVYQEDVIKVAHHFAKLTLGEADVLRRGMSGKFRSREEFQKVRLKFIENCRSEGYPDKLTFEVWAQIESFAGYAFAKGHSASYAVESYQSLFLKRYYPLEYMVAVLNNGGGFYRSEIYLHEARMEGAGVHPPCINKSEHETTIHGKDIYLGFQHLSGLERNLATEIVMERHENGQYESLDDFLDRVPTGLEQLEILIRIGAFRFSGVDKRTLLWQAHFRLNHQHKKPLQKQLFQTSRRSFELPQFEGNKLEEAFDQIELLGFPLCNPFDLLSEKPVINQLSKDMARYVNKTIELFGYLVTIKNTSTSKKERMQFGTFLDQEGHFIDTVHFPMAAARYPFRGKGIYKLIGKVVDEFGFLSLEISEMHKMAYITDPRYASTDFAQSLKHVP